jgi:hypothetical protein
MRAQPATQLIRVDARYAAHLKAQAERRQTTVVALTRTMVKSATTRTRRKAHARRA